MNATSRVDRIRQTLEQALAAQSVELIDDSHLHVGHIGAREGKGHYRVRIVSQQFRGLRPVQRHQLVYRSLGEMMHTDIHALNIEAITPEEQAALG